MTILLYIKTNILDSIIGIVSRIQCIWDLYFSCLSKTWIKRLNLNLPSIKR